MTMVDEAGPLEPARTDAREPSRPTRRADGRGAARDLARLARWLDEAVADGPTLVLHGEVTTTATPHLDAVLDQVVLLDSSALTVDLRRATTVSLDALAAIARRARAVDRFDLRLPEGSEATLLRLLDAA